MFLEFNEGSFLWEWHHSSLWLVASLIGVLGVALSMTYRSASVSRQVLKVLAIGSVVFTLPLALVRTGLAPEFMDSGFVGQLGLIGFTGSSVSIALPCMVRIIMYSLWPEFSEARLRPSIHVPSGFELDLPVDNAHHISAGATTLEDTFVQTGWQLTFLNGCSADQVHSLSKSEIVLGRSPECDLVINDPYVSRKHAKVLVQTDSLSLLDMGSKSGTIVDGTTIDHSTLTNGSKAVMGETTILFNSVS